MHGSYPNRSQVVQALDSLSSLVKDIEIVQARIGNEISYQSSKTPRNRFRSFKWKYWGPGIILVAVYLGVLNDYLFRTLAFAILLLAAIAAILIATDTTTSTFSKVVFGRGIKRSKQKQAKEEKVLSGMMQLFRHHYESLGGENFYPVAYLSSSQMQTVSKLIRDMRANNIPEAIQVMHNDLQARQYLQKMQLQIQQQQQIIRNQKDAQWQNTLHHYVTQYNLASLEGAVRATGYYY